MLITMIGLGGCGSKDKEGKATQSLASVNGKDITIHQLNEELTRANVPPAQQEAAKKQILQSLIDRQLLETKAIKAKVDRDPNVMQAIERAKSQIIAQAYIQSLVSAVAKPTRAEVEDYYQKHPETFSERKLAEMKQLLVDSRQVNDALKEVLKSAKSLDEVANWMDANNIQYDRGEISRSLAEMPADLASRLRDARKGQLFVISMGSRTMLILMESIKNSPIALDTAAPQIEQYLLNQKRKDAGEAELARLRSEAKIEYINQDDKPSEIEKSQEKPTSNSDMEHGVSGLK
ncbi:peptidyl-prolyl cis-trans isomerase, EpsD family [Methylovorus sp. MM2]|nr:peptidyl-prolyl cis-trans isomerase, EpsD family [Methylovorus sp. MM2]